MAEIKYAWRTLTQDQLDWAYDQSQHAANMNQLLDKFKQDSISVREEIGDPLRFLYGFSDNEYVDVYIPKVKTNKSAIIFMHGGAWKTGFAKSYSYLAPSFLDLGYTLFVSDFANAVQLNGDLSAMADQACRSIEWSLKNCQQLGIEQAFLVGHSSGAHLSAVYASNYKGYCSNNIPIKQMMLVSGLYDLEPVVLSSRRSYLNLTNKDVLDLSPIKHIESITIPTDIICGERDSPEFIRQSQELYIELVKKNSKTRFSCIENTNHFELLETINQLFIERISNEKDI